MVDKSKRMYACDNNKSAKACSAIRPRYQFQACAGCHSRFYCDQNCQRGDWKAGHAKECATMAAKYQAKQRKLKRRERKMKQAQKEAEARGETFHEAMALLFMDSDSEGSDSGSSGDDDASSHTGSLSHTSEEHKTDEQKAAEEEAKVAAELAKMEQECEQLEPTTTREQAPSPSKPRRRRRHSDKKRITCI